MEPKAHTATDQARRREMATATPRRPLEQATAQRLQEATQRATSAFGLASTGEGNVLAALQVAEGIADLRELFDQPEIKARIVALQDTVIGFRTDRDPKVKNRKTGEYNTPYGYEVVKDCAIEAALRGLQLVGNQWNIISGRTYCTREGFEFLIRRLTQVTDFKLILGVPASKPGGVIIECEATWTNTGKAQSLKASIPVKSDEYSGADQLLGKATRKFLKRCYEVMTGNVLPDGDTEEAAGKPEISAAPKPRFLTAAPTETSAEAHEFDAGGDPVAPAPTPTAPADTAPAVAVAPQAELAGIITGAGFTLDDLNKFAIAQQETAAEFASFDDIPTPLASKLVRARVGLLRNLTAQKGGGL